MHGSVTKYKAIVHYKYFLKSLRKVAKIHKIGKSTLCRWLQKEGIHIRKRIKKTKIEEICQFVNGAISNNPFITSYDISLMVQRELNISVSPTTCWRTLQHCGFSRKRSRMQISKHDTNANIQIFKDKYLQSKNMISIDETFFYLHDKPKYGYTKRGIQLRTTVGETHRTKKIAIYMAVSDSKIIGFKMAYKHGNSLDYLDFIKSLNCSNNTLLMDNVAFHKSLALREYVESMNCNIVFTPPYSPQFNPIEMVFSKMKTIYRKLNYRNASLMEENIVQSINSITTGNLQAYFSHVQKLCLSTHCEN